MSVKRHGSKWRADWRDEFHIRRRKDFTTKAEAVAHEQEMRTATRKVRSGERLAPTCDPDILVSAFAAEWLGARPALGIDQGTLSRQEISLRRHILPALGGLKVRALDRARCRAFLLAKLNAESAQGLKAGSVQHKRKPLSRGSVRQLHVVLSGLLSEAVERGLIESNPVAGLWRALSKGKAAQRIDASVKALDAAQAARFLASAKATTPRHYPYFATLLLAGLRPGEGLGVTTDKIDLRAGSLLVAAQVGQHGGLKTTKTGEARSVDLSAPLVAILREAIDARPKPRVVSLAGEALDGASEVGPFLLVPDLAAQPSAKEAARVYKNASRAMRRALAAAGLPTHLGLHALRHSYAVGLISRGISPAFVQQQLGHASIEMTVGTYGSHFPARVPGAVDGLAESFGLGHQMDTTGGLAAAEAL